VNGEIDLYDGLYGSAHKTTAFAAFLATKCVFLCLPLFESPSDLVVGKEIQEQRVAKTVACDGLA